MVGRPKGSKNKLKEWGDGLSYCFILLNLVHSMTPEQIAKPLDVSPIVIRAVMARLHDEYVLGNYDFLNMVMATFRKEDKHVAFHLLKYNFEINEE